MATQNLYVDGSGTYTNWDFPTFDPHFEQVDDQPINDGNSTEIKDDGVFSPNGTGPKDSFNIDDWTLGNKLITKVEVVFWAKFSQGADNTVRPFLRLNSTNTEGSQETLTSSYTEYTQEISRPGGGNWLYTDLDDLEVGVIASASEGNKLGDNIRVTQIYVKITYTENFATITSDAEIYSPYPTTFYLSKQNSDLSVGSEWNVKLREVIDEVDGYLDIPIDGYGTETCYAFTNENVPYNPDWESGDLRVKVITYAAGTEIYLKVSGSRINLDGEVQETTEATAEQEVGIVKQAYTFTIPSYNWTAGNYGDRLRINYKFRNPNVSLKYIYTYTGEEDSNVGTIISLHGIGTINSDAHITTDIPSLDFTGLAIAEVLKLIDDNDSEISIDQNTDTLAEMLWKIADTNGIDISGLSLAGIIQKFDIYYS